ASPCPPPPISPGQVPPPLPRHLLRHRVVAMRAAGSAAPQPRQPHPAARPEAEPPDGVARIFRTGRQVPAIPPHEGRQRVAVERDQENGGQLEGEIHCPANQRHDSVHQSCAASCCEDSSFPSAAATASNTSSVDICRAG